MQPTSIEAYQDIWKELGKRQYRIFSVLAVYDIAMTNTEIAEQIDWPINTVTPRVFELRQKGLVKEGCKRKCRVTGRMAIAWRVKRPDEAGERQMEMGM